MPPAQRILPTITYSDPTAGEPPGDVYRLFRGDSSPYTSICTKWRRILSAVVVSEGLWCRFLLPMAYTNAHDASPTPLPLTCKNILLYVEKVAMMGPPTLQLPLYSGQWRVYMLLLWWGTSPCGTGLYFDNLGTITKRDIWCALSYSKHNNNIQLVDWWRKYDHLQFTWGNPFTAIICQHIYPKHVSFE